METIKKDGRDTRPIMPLPGLEIEKQLLAVVSESHTDQSHS